MNLYNLFYGHKAPGSTEPEGERPKGVRLLGYLLRYKWWELIKLSILFWVFCLPVITIPASLRALSWIEIQYIRGAPIGLWPEFWDAFKKGFFRTTGIGALVGLMFAALIFGATFYGSAMIDVTLFTAPFVVLVLVILLGVMMLFYLFPLLAFSDLKLGPLLRNSLLLVLAYLPQNLAALGVLLLVAAATVLFFPYSFFLLVGFALSFVGLVACFASWPGLSQHVFHIEE